MSAPDLTEVVYVGKRNKPSGYFYTFYQVLPTGQAGKPYLIPVDASPCRWAIGGIYKVRIKDLTIDLNQFEKVKRGELNPTKVAGWVAHDAAAYHSWLVESEVQEINEQQRKQMEKLLSPIRTQYKRMATKERAAMREIIREILES